MSWQDLSATLDGVATVHAMRPGDVPLLMVHGIGPGTTGRMNFGAILDRLSPRFALHLIDLVGFGASGRKVARPFFDVEMWLRQIEAAVDKIFGIHRRAPILIGNSVGGALALRVAARRQDVRQVLAIGTPAQAVAPAALRAFWTAPASLETLSMAMRPMTGAETAPDPRAAATRFVKFAEAGYADYFNAMLSDPEGRLAELLLPEAEAARMKAQVTLMHGRADRACPAAAIVANLLPMLPDADLCLLGGCGHNVIAERSDEVLAAIGRLEKIVLT